MIARAIIRILDTITDYIFILACIIFFAGSFYAMYDSYLLYQEANSDSLLKFKPGASNDTEVVDKEIKGNMVGWVTLDDTIVDFPIMQGEDNSEYLNRNPYGEFSMSGSIFLDCRNSGDFTDPYSLVYGHHMDQGKMFGALDDYREADFFQTHTTGSLIVGTDIYKLDIFAVLEADATEECIFAPTEFDDKTLLFVLENAMHTNSQNLPAGRRMLALSTCKYPDTTARTIVMTSVSDLPVDHVRTTSSVEEPEESN